jgi:phosphate transport system substrate-binding protein
MAPAVDALARPGPTERDRRHEGGAVGLRPRLRRAAGATTVVLAAMLPVMMVAGAGEAGASPVLQTGGASFVGPAMTEWDSQVSEVSGININYQMSSSVLGLNDFAQNELDFGESDIPYASGQAQFSPGSPYQYLPDVAGAVAFMYNLTGNDGNRITSLNLDTTAIDDIFTGRIVYWDDPVINNSTLNPQLVGDLPHTKIIPVYRSDASGENYLLSDYLLHLDYGAFTAYQAAVGAEVGHPQAIWPTPPNGRVPSGYPNWALPPEGANGSDGAAETVAEGANDGAITFVETAFAKEHGFPVASVVNASGNAVQPTSRNDAVALERAILYSDLSENLSNVYTNPLPDTYPLSSYSYFVTPCSPQLARAQNPPTACAANNSGTSSFSPAKGATLGQFVNFVACTGQQDMAQLGYSPLPPNLVAEDFVAVGRLNGGSEPPPPTAANCKNPYVDGQTSLPGAPVIEGGAGTAAGSAATADYGVGTGGAGSGGAGGSSGGPAGAAAGPAGAGANGSAGNSAELARLRAADAGPNKFTRADELAAAASKAGLLSAPMIVLWTVLALAAVGLPPAVLWFRRRRDSASPGATGNAPIAPGVPVLATAPEGSR